MNTRLGLICGLLLVAASCSSGEETLGAGSNELTATPCDVCDASARPTLVCDANTSVGCFKRKNGTCGWDTKCRGGTPVPDGGQISCTADDCKDQPVTALACGNGNAGSHTCERNAAGTCAWRLNCDPIDAGPAACTFEECKNRPVTQIACGNGNAGNYTCERNSSGQCDWRLDCSHNERDGGIVVCPEVFCSACPEGTHLASPTDANGCVKECKCQPDPTCKADSDCRLFDDYCTGCDCRVLGPGQSNPTCHGNGVQCLVQACRGKAAVCKAGKCAIANSCAPDACGGPPPLAAGCTATCSPSADGACGWKVDCKPPAPTCKVDTDCRLYDDYCTGCDCRALGPKETPTCAGGNTVQCLLQPCGGKQAVCKNGTCQVADAPNTCTDKDCGGAVPAICKVCGDGCAPFVCKPGDNGKCRWVSGECKVPVVN